MQVARIRLHRAGDIMQRIFYAYREQAFEKLIIKIEKENDTMYLIEGQYGEREVLVSFLTITLIARMTTISK